MKELSINDIQKLQDMKKPLLVEASTRNPALFRYLSTNSILNERVIISDPLSNTYIQLINNDGSLDIISQYLTAKNLTIEGLSVFNDATIKSNLKSKGLLDVNNIISSGNVTMNQVCINKLSIGGNIQGSSGVLNISDKIINIGTMGSHVNIMGTMNYINVDYLNINNKELVVNSVSGNKMLLPTKDVGIYLSDGLNDKVGFIKTDSITGDSFVLKAPSCQYILETPKLTSNSTFIISNQDGLVDVENINCTSAKSNNIIVNDTLSIGENVKIDNNNVSIASNINILGNATIGSNTEIKGRLDVLEDTRMYSDLAIEGGLNIQGNSIFNNTIISGNNCVVGNLEVDGEVKINNSSHFNSLVAISGSLEVNSILSADSDGVKIVSLDVTSLNVASNGSIKNLKVNNLDIHNNLLVGNIQSNNISMKGSLDISGIVTIGENISLSGSINIDKDLTVDGNVLLNGPNVVIDGGLKINKRGLIVNGSSIFNNSLNLQKNLNVAKGIIVTGNSSFNDSIVTISGSLEVLGDTIITGNTKISNSISVGEQLEVLGEADMKKLNVTELAIFNSDTITKNNALVQNSLVVLENIKSNNLTILNDSIIGNNLSIGKNISIGNDLIIKNNVSIENELVVEKDVEFKNSNTKMNGSLDLIGKLNVLGDVSLNTNKVNISGVLETSSVIVNDSLKVYKESNFMDKVNINNKLVVLDDLAVGGILSISSSAFIDKNLIVLSESHLGNNVSISGTVTIGDNITISNNNICISGKLDFNDKLIVNTPSIISDSLAVYKSSTYRSDLAILGGLKVSKNVLLGQGLGILKGLEIGENVNVAGNIRANGDISGDNLKISNSASIEKSLTIGESLNINNISIRKDEILLGNSKVATQDYIQTLIATYNCLSLDSKIEKIDNIAEGVYTYLVTEDNLDTFEGLGEDINGQINCLVEDLENNIYVGGSFKTINGINSPYLAKWIRKTNSWQAIDNSCLGVVQSLVINSKNELYIAGAFINNTTNTSNLIKYNPRDNSFTAIEGFIGFIKCLIIDSDDNIYVGGLFERVNGVLVNNLCKINISSGNIVGLGMGLSGIVTGLLIDRNDNIYISGGSKNIYKYDTTNYRLIQLDGLFNDSIYTMALDRNNNLYVGGRFNKISINDREIECKSIAKYNYIENKWESLGDGLYPDVKSIVIDINNLVYVSTNTIDSLMVYNSNNLEWQRVECGINGQGQILSMILDSYNHLYLGGSFNKKLIKYCSKNNKVLKFFNTLKLVEDGKVLNCRKVIFNSLSDTISIQFKKNVGHIIYKSGNIELIR